MFGTTMLLTVGHALDRAKDEGMPVRLNVGGEGITGRIINTDGHGVAVLESNGDMCVFRPEAISGVRVPRRAAAPEPADAWPTPDQRGAIRQHEFATQS